MDSDVQILSIEQLQAECQRLRDGIRKHRDEKGHDRCWMDDNVLYALLPEADTSDQELPPLDEWKKECAVYCEQYWNNRQKHDANKSKEKGD